MLPDFGTQNALLLQGPNGPFFRRLAAALESRGATVTKVNFNPGDALFFRGDNAISYRAPMDEWPVYFRALVAERNIDAIFLFGDCRPLHRDAVRIANELGIAVWVFEEGYLRPDHFTVERGGVNGNSPLSKDPAFYRRATRDLPELPDPVPVGNTFGIWAWYTALNALVVTLFGWRYPHYRHHRTVNAWYQMFCWLRAGVRKAWYRLRERGVLGELRAQWSGKYFFVPLQVHCDAQLSHSPFAAMEDFIEHCVAAFAAHAPPDTRLVFKHHPHDRAYRDYGRLLRKLGKLYGCADRVVYVHDLHLPTLLKSARGVITMNSTVGTSALYHRTPVIALGNAVYDIRGLTFQGELAEFLRDPGDVDSDLFAAFCRWLRETSQVNGSFYKRTPGLPTDPKLQLWAPAELSSAGDSASWGRRDVRPRG
jgi:capsule polysaccharide modification protein KpsS